MQHFTVKPHVHAGRKAWMVVGLLFIVAALNYLDRTMITTMRSSIVGAIPMTDAQFGLLTAVFLWVYGLLSPFAGFLADKFNRRKVIIVSLFIWSLVTWLTSYAETFNQLLITRALMGVSEACYIPAALALIADYHRGATRSLATGIHMGGVMVGQSLGFVGGWIAEQNTWNSAFGFLGIAGMLYAVLIIFLLKDPPKDTIAEEKTGSGITTLRFGDAFRNLFGSRSFILLVAYWGLLGIVSWSIMGWLPTYYQEHFSLSQSVAGVYATAYLYPAAFAGLLIGGFWADRWSRTNSNSRILVPVIGLLAAAPFIYAATELDVLLMAVICFMLYGMTRSFCDANTMPILCMIADSRYRATGYGILNLFSCIVGGTGLYLGGYMRDMEIGIGPLYKMAAVAMLICAGLLYGIIRAGKRAKQ